MNSTLGFSRPPKIRLFSLGDNPRTFDIFHKMGKSGKTFYLSPDLDIPPPEGFYAKAPNPNNNNDNNEGNSSNDNEDNSDSNNKYVPGRLALGSILRSVDDAYPMNTVDPPLPAARVTKTGVRYTLSDLMSGSAGIWGWLPGSKALGGSIEASHSLDKVLAVTEVVTISINKPLDEVMNTEVANASVQSYLARTKCKKPLFMITAIKIARGASCTESRQQGVHGAVRAPIGVGVQGAPPLASLDADARKSHNEGYAYEGSGDFVLGYQVRKITCTPSGERIDEPHASGAALGDPTETDLSVSPGPFTIKYQDEWVDNEDEDMEVVEEGNESPEESSRWIIL